MYGITEEKANALRTGENGNIQTIGLNVNTTNQFVSALYGNESVLSYYSNASNGDHTAMSNIPSFDYNGIDNTIKNATTCPFFAYQSHLASKFNHIPMFSMLSLFALEHNRIANELHVNHSTWGDEKLFLEARQLNIALWQHVVYNEYIPILLSKNFNHMNLTYNSSIDATTSGLYCTVGQRYGHGVMSQSAYFGGISNRNGTFFGKSMTDVITQIPYRDSWTHPCIGLDVIGSENYLKAAIIGLSLSAETKISPKYCEELRSFLSPFDHLKTTNRDIGQWDLLAADILRSRDHGIPSYNDAREIYGLSRITQWSELTSNKFYQNALSLLYDDVDDLDTIVGAFIEEVEASHNDSSNGSGYVGKLFAAILNEQYYRTFAGDKLFYQFNETLKNFAEGTYMSDIVKRNTDIENVKTDLFVMAESNQNGATSAQSDVDGYNTVFLLELSL